MGIDLGNMGGLGTLLAGAGKIVHAPDIGLSKLTTGIDTMFGTPKAEASTGDGLQGGTEGFNPVSGGQVGAPTLDFGSGNKKTSSSSSGKSASSQANLDKLRRNIANQFSDVISTYQNQIVELPQQQETLLANVDKLAGTQKQTINDSLSSALQKIQGYRSDVQTQQNQTLQDLADNTRNLFQAGNVYLGTKGAGDSSATGMYSAALTQAGNKQRAGVQRDVNSTMSDINAKEIDTNNTFKQQLDAVDTWHATQQQTIVSQYTDLKRQLEQAKANASAQEKANLNNLDAQLYEAAKSQLYNLQGLAAQAKNSLNSDIQTSGSGLGAVGANAVSGASQYNVGQIVQPDQIDISGLQDVGYGNQAMFDKVSGNFWKKNDDGTYAFLGNGINANNTNF